jgi:hypothetical protein
MSSASDSHILGPGLLPTPFTADEIRDGCRPGRTIRLLVEAPGEAAYVRVNRFGDVDAEGATLERWKVGPDGAPEGPITGGRTTWRELQAHASFSADATTVTRERITIPAGTFDCLRYTVTHDESVQTFWFALTAPGMPVKYQTAVDGRVVSSVTMLEDERPSEGRQRP